MRELVNSSVDGPPIQASVAAAARVVLRPIANPLPLGFLALAAATLVLAALQLRWLPASQGTQVALILLAFVFPLQLVSSVFGYLARDVVAGTGMGVLAGSWLSIALIQLTSEPGSTSDALGVFLLAAGVAMTIPALGALSGKLVPVVILGTTAVRFATAGLYELTAADTWRVLTGIVGLVLFALALYGALAMTLEDAARRTRLPLGRRGFGR
jgi:succinate-acetate transporter protein